MTLPSTSLYAQLWLAVETVVKTSRTCATDFKRKVDFQGRLEKSERLGITEAFWGAMSGMHGSWGAKAWNPSREWKILRQLRREILDQQGHQSREQGHGNSEEGQRADARTGNRHGTLLRDSRSSVRWSQLGARGVILVSKFQTEVEGQEGRPQ